MTKKDFELVAQVMSSNAPRIDWLNKRQQWRMDCRVLAHRFKQLNENFKTARFCEACGFTRDELYEIG